MELLIAALLFSFIIGASVLVFNAGLKAWSFNKDRADIRQDSVLAMDMMARYFSLASSITAASATGITFKADVDDNGTDDDVTFSFDAVNKKLDRVINTVTTKMASNVQSLALSYCQSGTETTFTPADQAGRNLIRIVIMDLTMNKGNETIVLRSNGYCRNQT